MRAFVPVLVLASLSLSATAEAREAHVVSLGAYGTTDLVVVRGRALKGGPPTTGPGAPTWRKLASTAHAFTRRDLERARVLIEDVASHKQVAVTTDDEGFFVARLPGPFAAGHLTMEVRVDHGKYRSSPTQVGVEIAAGNLLVIADLDDTLIDTGVTQGRLAVIKRAAVSGAEDLRPIDGAAAAMHAFAKTGAAIVYLTASPVELAPRLSDFLRLRGFPEGALFVRHYESDGMGDPSAYKRRHLDTLLADFPRARVVLLGDNGEHDPEIFARLAADTADAGRIAARYIRATLPAVASEARYSGAVVFRDWSEALEHARVSGVLAR